MRIVAYTYAADVHCVACAKEQVAAGLRLLGLKRYRSTPLDEHGLPVDCCDGEGNPWHPVFATDEHDFTHCGTCRREL